MFLSRSARVKLRRFHRRLIEDSGQSQIEFAMSCIVLLPVLFGIMVFGMAMNNYLMLTEATSAGARQLAVRTQPGWRSVRDYGADGSQRGTPPVEHGILVDRAGVLDDNQRGRLYE